MVNFEDQETMRLTGDDIVAGIAEVLQGSCRYDVKMSASSIPSRFFGKKQQETSLETYLTRLYRYLDCSNVAYVTALVYLRRIEFLNDRCQLTHGNIHRLHATALLIAIKYHDDEHYSNLYYAQVFGMSGLAEINELESLMLSLLGFGMSISEEEYYAQKIYIIKHRQAVSSGNILRCKGNTPISVA
uniref:Cyclin n=1 Tax=Rhodosorus marinus TaxID=101924 RepID=A0A7S3A258_9RHOD|mmetsp:Transcript_380/g.755  ORF Transcript_380/g.755 Transcript_380/m.755 type:complete len:187 (+) Transcript_380:3-563(+)